MTETVMPPEMLANLKVSPILPILPLRAEYS